MLAIFDVEGVLLNAEYLPVLANLIGPEKEKEIWDITNKGIRGEINWEEGLIERVHALRGIGYDKASKIAAEFGDNARSKRIVFFLKGAGLEVSGRFGRV